MKPFEKRYSVTQKPLKVGDAVTVHSVFGGYALPPGLAENEAVTVVKDVDHGRLIVKTEVGEFDVSLACIDSGWIREPW